MIIKGYETIFYLVTTLLLLNLQSTSPKADEIKLKPEDLGLKIKMGQIDRTAMTRSQMDTILISPFTFDDNFEDIVIYHYSKKSIVIYKNLANGYVTPLREIKTEGEVKRIGLKFDVEQAKQYPYYRPGIEVEYSNGEKQILNSQRINYGDVIYSKAPYRNFLDDPKVFLYNLLFIDKL